MDRLRMRSEELPVAAPARPSGNRTRRRDGLSTTAAAAVAAVEGAGAAMGAAFQHVLTASTVTYDQSEHCPIRLYERGMIARLLIGGGPRGRTRLRCKVIAYCIYERLRVIPTYINSQSIREL
jgi:hypothetical protein